ncbi:GNAT family N-acetyltransferase [Microbacterium sp. Marseille-Q6965]|uniref:GNAT family N-acetyltransferase n=1 Tax=Microbacterium sp. Marseille-Q6965 TaxID=2965072 RepID=UPI0021B8073D|nr:GNAT family N-acetyltransferase [Microbacterium sp. Marseille-Q6965]
MGDRRWPAATARLRFRELEEADLDDMAALLGDPRVMAFYPAPKTRDEAAGWIARNRARYAEEGFGLWAVETHEGDFVGDCGLTWQQVNGRRVLEVGYHVRAELQGRGYATEAARACVEEARRRFATGVLTAIIHPENIASRRVAEKLGMAHTEDDRAHPWIVRAVMSLRLG